MSQSGAGPLVLLTSSFPFGRGEEFLEDEIPILAERFPRITIVSEDGRGAARPLPDNCHAVVVNGSRASPRWRLAPRLIRELLADPPARTGGVRRRLHALRSVQFYLQQASAVERTIEPHLSRARNEGPPCFYSYWMDHKALAAVRLARSHFGSIAVSRAHGYDLYAERHPYGYLPMRKRISEGLAAVFAVSDHGARRLAEAVHGVTTVVTSRLGVPPLALRAPEPPADPAPPLRVISIGSLVPVKRVALLIDSLADFLPADRVSWCHVGDGPLGPSLAEKAGRLLRIPYQFMGQLPVSAVRALLKSAARRAVLVNTSASEGIPVSMMEAMACGIPCIGPDVGAVSEIVEDGANGYLLPPNPLAAEIGDAIRNYGNLPSERAAEFRNAAHRTWAIRYNAADNYATFADLLALLLRPGRDREQGSR